MSFGTTIADNNFMKTLTLLFVLAGVLSAQSFAVTVKSSAVETIKLIANGVVPNSASIAYDPNVGLYYGSRAGSTSYTAAVWDNAGVLKQTVSPMGADARGWNYNPNTGNLELVTFTSDLLTVNRDASGNLLGTYSTLISNMSGSPTSQTMPSYNASTNEFYAYGNGGSSLSILDRATGALKSVLSLDLVAAGVSSLNSYFVGYDAVKNVLVGASGTSAHVFGMDGSFLGSSSLSVSTRSSFNAGYANGQLFVYDNSIGGFQGFNLFDNTPTNKPAGVPDSGTSIALLGLGMTVVFAMRRRVASKS